jgi:hypothetical protein
MHIDADHRLVHNLLHQEISFNETVNIAYASEIPFLNLIFKRPDFH